MLLKLLTILSGNLLLFIIPEICAKHKHISEGSYKSDYYNRFEVNCFIRVSTCQSILLEYLFIF